MANKPKPVRTLDARTGTQGRRLTIDVSEATAAQIDRMVALTGASTSTLVRTALVALAMAVEAEASGRPPTWTGCLPFAVRRDLPRSDT